MFLICSYFLRYLSLNVFISMVLTQQIACIRNYSKYSPTVPVELFLAISLQNHSDSNEDVDRVHVDRDRVIDRIVGFNLTESGGGG